MRLILAFLLGVLASHLWNNPQVIEEWKTEAQNRFELFQSGVHAATE